MSINKTSRVLKTFGRLLEDPVSLELMEDAMMTSCGHSFSLRTVEQLEKSNNTCPICNSAINPETTRPNYKLREIISKYKSTKHQIRRAKKKEKQRKSASGATTPPPKGKAPLSQKSSRLTHTVDPLAIQEVLEEGSELESESFELPSQGYILVSVLSSVGMPNRMVWCQLSFPGSPVQYTCRRKGGGWPIHTFLFNVQRYENSGSLRVSVWGKWLGKKSVIGSIEIPFPEIWIQSRIRKLYYLKGKGGRDLKSGVKLRMEFKRMKKKHS